MGIEHMKHLKIFIFFCILTFTVSCGQQKKYIEYSVKEGETMRVIAENLDMKTRDLLRLNPGVSRKPDVNTVIVIPNKKKTKTTQNKVEDPIKDIVKEEPTEAEIKETKEKLLEELKKNFVVYEVKKGDTFYSLTRFYNLTQEEMISLNPELSEGLKTGQIIKIKPIKEGDEVEENAIYEDTIDTSISLKVALMLPFKAQNYDSISHEKIFSKSTSLINTVTDFYLGVQIAVDSLRNKGLNIELNVIDTQKNSSQIKSIITQYNLNNNDVIIGPLYSEEATIVASQVNVPVVYPVYSKNQSKFSSSKLIKTSPEKTIFRDELVTYIKDNFKGGNLIVVGDGKMKSNLSSTFIKKSLETDDYISIVHVLKPKDGYIAKEKFLQILKPNTNNWVVLTTNNNIIVEDAINSLISLPDFTNVKVFTYDKAKAFDSVDNLKLAKIGFTYVSDDYVDEASLSTQLFNKQYYKKNNALPSFYATKGFDITYDILMRLASGNKLKETFNQGASFRVESKFDYINKPFGVSENNGLFILQYKEDLTLIRLK
jgi:LysM repeat protein